VAGDGCGDLRGVAYVAFSDDSKTVTIWDRAAETIMRLDINGHTLKTIDTDLAFFEGRFAFTPDSKYIAVAGRFELCLYDLTTQMEPLKCIQLRSDVSSLALSPDGTTIATVRREDAAIQIWDMKP
jgi:WD40 repeat protein